METRTKVRDGIIICQLRCPNCFQWGEIDKEQYEGRISILCDCGFHETINLKKEHESGMTIAENKPIILYQCPPGCKSGEHKWDGPPWESEDRQMGSVTCSKCGARAIDVDLLKLP